ncbi:hypothetical protein [Oleidesulfovibrio sp.]|uniref:hypothetical protein n=1 Tax=Oleidesulfovibrio sp. TaxID=2909707 RepID=UPI003A858F24
MNKKNSPKNVTDSLPPAPPLVHLADYLPKLPPCIARKKVAWFTGGAISSKKLANDDALCKGPLVRQKIGETVIYPTEYFLAYLESRGVRTIIVPQL